MIQTGKSRLRFILYVTLAHMALTVVFFLWSFSVVMAHAAMDCLSH